MRSDFRRLLLAGGLSLMITAVTQYIEPLAVVASDAPAADSLPTTVSATATRPTTRPLSPERQAAVVPPSTYPADVSELIVTRKGTLPLILSCPHDGRNKIEATTRTTGIRSNDKDLKPITLALVEELEKRLGGRPYLVLFDIQRLYSDVNRGPADIEAFEDTAAAPYYHAYHKALYEFTDECQRRWPGRCMLLDMHGQGSVPEIVRGTRTFKTLQRLMAREGVEAVVGPKSIFGVLEAKGYPVRPACSQPTAKETLYNGGFIVAEHGTMGERGIDAMQIELPKSVRVDDENRNKIVQDLADAIETFYKTYQMPATSEPTNESAGRPSSLPLERSSRLLPNQG